MYIRFSSLRLRASSISQGKLVAANTITIRLTPDSSSVLVSLKPSICTRSSDFTLLDASCSDSEPLREQSESISSINIVDGA